MIFLIKPLKFPSIGKRTKVCHLYNGRIGTFENFLCRTTTLKPYTLPHTFHSHAEAELIISLSGNLEILTNDKPLSQTQNSTLIEPGSFAYHSPFQTHTLRCLGPEAAKYLFFKWNRADIQPLIERGTLIHFMDVQDSAYFDICDGFRFLPIDDLTEQTKGSIQAYLSYLEPGMGYKPHRDKFDTVAVLIEGELEIFKVSIRAPAFLFFASGTPLKYENTGSSPARFYVFEFHKPNIEIGITAKN